MAREREATLVLFQGRDGKGPTGKLEVHKDLKAGDVLTVQLYSEVSGKGNKYHRGPCFIPAVITEVCGGSEGEAP